MKLSLPVGEKISPNGFWSDLKCGGQRVNFQNMIKKVRKKLIQFLNCDLTVKF